eukprot:TRINITY_DN31580_c0_g1_i1.p1 TRINITY_DN31580_c0_g1~~TRINITY_DN31580_c0_g1_i1.p1  ORF type:complete len:252 (-),score=4.69 TRINITY_DN31580_c0_g1_i1:244-933(-)
MAPMMVLQDGKLRAVIGGAGGPFIITSVLQVLLHFFCQGFSPLAAITAPRLHHQLLPNMVFYEAGHALDDGERISFDGATLAALQRRGHATFPITFGGFVQMVVQDLEVPLNGSGQGNQDVETLVNWSRESSEVPVEARGRITAEGSGQVDATVALDLEAVARRVQQAAASGPRVVEAAAAAVADAGVGVWRTLPSRDATSAGRPRSEPFRGRLTAVSDPRKDGRPAGY